MKKLRDLFDASSSASSLGNRFRKKRMVVFEAMINQLPKPIRILDVGGDEYFWVNAGFQNRDDIQIVLLNLTQSKVNSSNMKSITGDATNLSEHADNSFDIVFSNSVIEHLETMDRQIKMANEVVRVGRYHYIQTPNKYFIVEPHYLLPYFQFVPKPIKYFVLTKTKLSRLIYWDETFARNYVNEIRLCSLKDMKRLFPKSKIWIEKVLLMSKSFVAHNLE